MGKTHSDEDHRDETVIRKEGTQGPFTANVDPGIREAETKVGIALPKESIEHRSQADSRKKGNHSKGVIEMVCVAASPLMLTPGAAPLAVASAYVLRGGVVVSTRGLYKSSFSFPPRLPFCFSC